MNVAALEESISPVAKVLKIQKPCNGNNGNPSQNELWHSGFFFATFLGRATFLSLRTSSTSTTLVLAWKSHNALRKLQTASFTTKSLVTTNQGPQKGNRSSAKSNWFIWDASPCAEFFQKYVTHYYLNKQIHFCLLVVSNLKPLQKMITFSGFEFILFVLVNFPVCFSDVEHSLKK